MTILRGSCHCGNVEAEFSTALTPAELELRACQCAFCRRHGAKTVSDPEGQLTIHASPGAIERYRFGFAVTDFILCRHCGSYVAPVSRDTEMRGSLNVVGMGIAELAGRDATGVNLDNETAEGRRERRRKMWTPTQILERAAA